MSERGALVGVLYADGLIGRTSCLVGFRASWPKTWAAFDGIGGAGGAFLGNKLGGGALGTMGGLIAGAIGANVLSDK